MDVEDLFRRYGPMVIRRCRQLLKDEDEALEVSQDVFVKLLSRRGILTLHNPSSFLYRTATNLSLNRIRDRSRRPVNDDNQQLHKLASMTKTAAQLEARSMLRHLFGRHQESSRLIAVLHFVDGLTLQEVAKLVGMSIPGVRKRIRALRKTLNEMEKP